MKIQPQKVEGFINTLSNSGVFSVLIYGPDAGGISNLSNQIAGKIIKNVDDPFSTTILDNERLNTEPTIILDELSSISFFGDKKLVIFRNADKDSVEAITSAIKDISEGAKKASFLIVTAGELTPASPLRKLYEEATTNLAAVAVYVEDERDLTAKITRIFTKKNLRVKERGIIEYLAQSCQGDSKIIESEIEKLELYLGDRKEIMLEDVLASTGNTTETEIQDVCDMVVEGKKASAEMMLKKGFDSGMQPIAVIRTMQRYIEKLHNSANSVLHEGKTIDAAIAGLRPPLFFKQVPKYRSHLSIVIKKPANDFWDSYSILYNAESEIKTSGADPEMITSHAISKIFERK